MSLKDYVIGVKLGGGGNGNVFLAKDSNQQDVAIKISKIKNPKDKNSRTRLIRFMIEAQKGFELSQSGQQGLIPILHYELPCKKTGEYFFVMPVATPLEKKTNEIRDIYELISIFENLALALVELHAKGISHRDIKPDNILYFNSAYFLSDLGLIDFPEKEDLTREKESLGNRKTMAPEMRTPKEAEDHRPADVYSFAKTVWMVLAKEQFSFDGQFNPFENQKLQQKYPKQHFVELYQLFSDATYEHPTKRPTMLDFLGRLRQWKEIAQNSRKAARSTWHFIEKSVIQQFSPSTVIWRDVSQAVEILQKLAIFNFNHTFIPTGGGMDMIKIERAHWLIEPNMMALSFQFRLVHVFKLKRLIWENPNNDPRFSYFRLEFDTVDPIFPEIVKALEEWVSEKFGGTEKDYSEDLNVNSKGEYEQYNPEDQNAVQVTRWHGGAFLIVLKSSIYNEQINMAYDGRHSSFNTDDFREYMEMLQSTYTHPILGRYFRSIAESNPIEDGFMVELKEMLQMSHEELKSALNEDQDSPGEKEDEKATEN